MSLQLESLEDRVVPTGLITLVPGNAIIPFSTSSQTAPISVQVNTPLGGLNLGTVDVALLVNGQPVTLAAAKVTNGHATVGLPVPGGLLAGTYTLVEDLLVGGVPVLSDVLGSLTVSGNGSAGGSGSSTGGGTGSGVGGGAGAGAGAGAAGQTALQAAIEIAIDTAAILLQGNSSGEMTLQIASQVFLNKALPSDLIGDLLAHIPAADGLALAGIVVGIDYADNVMGSSS